MRSTILALITAALLIGATEVAYRLSGGHPSSVAGLSYIEFQWKIERAAADKTIFVVGDSRVGWGFAEQVFSEEFRKTQQSDLRGLNAGLPAISIESLIRYIANRDAEAKPGVMVINFSPAGFYYFTDFPGAGQVKYQDILDEKIRLYLQEKVFTFGREYKELYSQFKNGRHPPKRAASWVSRTVFPEGSVNAVIQYNDGTPLDPAEYQLDNYNKIFKAILADQGKYLARKEAALKAIEKARAAGWKFVLVRFPLGNRMRELEEQLPQPFRPETIATELGIAYIDYNQDPRTRDLRTLDESHLTPESARTMATVLAHDLPDLLSRQPLSVPLP